jgi:NADH:ubiquinone oxidoreductase subunit 4 (subunit M)
MVLNNTYTNSFREKNTQEISKFSSKSDLVSMFTILWTLTAAAAIVLSVTYHWWVVKRQKLEKIHVNVEMEQLRKRNTVLEQVLQAERLRLDQSN